MLTDNCIRRSDRSGGGAAEVWRSTAGLAQGSRLVAQHQAPRRPLRQRVHRQVLGVPSQHAHR